jgi:hypothetical protein
MYRKQNTNLMKIYSCAERELEKPSFRPIISLGRQNVP